MIEVITYAECVLRLNIKENYEQFVTSMLMNLSNEIITEKIVSVSAPQINPKNQALETNVLAKFCLYIPEDHQNKNVEEYVNAILPFLKRYLPKCNDITSTKIIQMKRILQT
ncbi:hypothetical protein [Metabacillus litoralis]|uniref:hypothetical protein n=1 Tax=Metabacillus litoralis TaxID=152268 RepID=UPI00203FF371|nr:hypothetical protein [Metabacillus litoralis]MCM3163625.1 hypothetical protein [Metabacillus litoralis]